MTIKPTIPASACRRLLLAAQGLCHDPARPPALDALVLAMGFVQLDTISVVTRAQHLTLLTRMDAYQPAMLTELTETKRFLFEHWTHDASLVPTQFFRYWRHRFERYAQGTRRSAWWREQLGDDADRVIAHVEDRITREGALRSADFENETGVSGNWWTWKPQKAALEFLWRRGRLAVHSRRGNQKVYDLTERVLPEAVRQPEAAREEYVDWACSSALQRLGVATPSELVAFWNAIELRDARAWCDRETAAGRVVAVLDASARPAFAVADWEERLQNAPPPPRRLRLLCPFDPIVRDRARLERLFGFHYRFEAFVPPPQRQYGYYVLPMMYGEKMVGRIDLKLHRDAARLEVRGQWWEPGQKPLNRPLDAALQRLAGALGADTIKTG